MESMGEGDWVSSCKRLKVKAHNGLGRGTKTCDQCVIEAIYIYAKNRITKETHIGLLTQISF